jgi:hypothetical protein
MKKIQEEDRQMTRRKKEQSVPAQPVAPPPTPDLPAPELPIIDLTKMINLI